MYPYLNGIVVRQIIEDRERDAARHRLAASFRERPEPKTRHRPDRPDRLAGLGRLLHLRPGPARG